MNIHRFQPHSLKARVTLFTLLIVVICMGALARYSGQMLQKSIQQLAGEQQRSALSVLVAQVNHGLQDRFSILETVASRATPIALDDQAALQSFLLERPFLASLFNGGVMVWNQQGGLLANVQFQASGSMANVLDPQDLASVLKKGQNVIGGVRRHDQLGVGVFAMAVPIHNVQGAIIGALSAVIRLDQANFLSALTAHHYGQSGNFFLIEPRQRLIFATSDKKRLMEVLPAAGISPWIDRFMQGFEGTARVVNPLGVEVLVSIEQIPLAHWYASVTMSPAEALAPVLSLRSHLGLAALVMLLLCAGLIWLILRHLLAPMLAAVKTLDGFTTKNQPPQALPVFRQDEIGHLVGGFNRLLDTLAQQQNTLLISEQFKQAVLNSVTAKIAVLDQDGVIVAVNEAWKRFALENAEATGHSAADTHIGVNYLSADQGIKADAASTDVMALREGIVAVLEGRSPRFYLEYPGHSQQQQRWFSMSVTPLGEAPLRGVVLSYEDISERIQAENQVRELAFYDPLTHLPNRRLAMERLAQQMVRARRTQCRLALLFIDLDKFKPINDELGHEVGDWLLQAVAQRIQSCLRESDTAARIGGDEFVALLPDLQTVDAAVAVAEKIRQALAQEFVTAQGAALRISSSIGVALYPDHGETEQDLLRLGDAAMYQAKKGGRNAVVLCAPVTPTPTPDVHRAARQSFVHLRWKAAFASGNPEIDQEHQALFALTNALLDRAALRQQQPLEFNAAFESLLKHVTEHFAHEEAILRAHRFTHLTEHAQEHQALVARAQNLYLQAQAAPADDAAAAGLVKFLVIELVTGHMQHSDRAFFTLFAGPG